jgi:Spy/CpxP family protein refolding chaperone
VAKAAYTQQLLDRAQAYVEQPLNDRRYDQGLQQISQLYAEITGEPVGKCRQCQYKDFLEVVTSYIREATRFLHPELMADSKYTFAPGFAGEVIADGRYNKTVTAENLTDQDAEALIKLGYGHVIIAKPGETLLAGASAEGGTDDEPADEPGNELQVQVEQAQKLFADEQAAHEQTKQALDAKNEQYTKLVANNNTNIEALQAEKNAHAATKTKLTTAQKQLATAQAKLNTQTTASGATDPATVPAVSTSDAAGTPSAPAVTAPAPPTTPAEGTPGN